MTLNSKQIIRNFQLYLLSDIELEEPYLSIYNDLCSCFKDLNIYISDDKYHSRFIYYGKSKKDLYIQYDEKNEDIWLDYDKIWSVFQSKYDLAYQTIQGITTWSAENTSHLKGTTNRLGFSLRKFIAENTLHLKGTTNKVHTALTFNAAENTLHLKGTTNRSPEFLSR